MMKRHLLEAATLIVAAILCATIANALASRERKMALVGTYPNALKVPQEPVPTPAEPVAPSAQTATAAPTTTATQPPATAIAATTTAAPPPTSTVPTTTTRTAPPTQPATNTAPNPQPIKPAVPPPTTHQPPPDVAKFVPHPDKPYIEITYADVAALHNAGALFLDARRTSIYEQGHIAGARPFSVWESDIDEKVNKLFGERSDASDQAKPIVVYCSGGECEDSHMLAQKLWGIQFNNVYVYKDGFPDWQKHGGATHTGGQP
jgi:rhodanese-related sulfurtransferase